MFQARKRVAPWSGWERLGFVFKRQRGSHVILRRGNRGCVVPMHREISRGTLRGILEQAGVSVEEFIDAL